MSKDYDIRVRVSEDEKKRIEAKATLQGLPTSAYVRILALNSNMKIKTYKTPKR